MAARRVFRLRNIIVLIILVIAGVGAWTALRPAQAKTETGSTSHTIAPGTIEDTLVGRRARR
jgi:hypothetical protein